LNPSKIGLQKNSNPMLKDPYLLALVLSIYFDENQGFRGLFHSLWPSKPLLWC
jgi:hypothetical protein